MVELVYVTAWFAVLIIAAIACFVGAAHESTPVIGKAALVGCGLAALFTFIVCAIWYGGLA